MHIILSMRNPKIIALILITALTISVFFYKQHRDKTNLIEAKELWQQTQKEAAQIGLEIDFKKIIHTNSPPGISLLDDHPKAREWITSYDEKSHTLWPSIEYSKETTLKNFRTHLSSQISEKDTPQIIYKTLLNNLKKSLDSKQFIIQAINNSQNFGPEYLSEKLGFIPVAPFRDIVNELNLIIYCKSHLNLNYQTEFTSLNTLINVFDKSSPSLIKQTILTAFTLETYHTILCQSFTSPTSVSLLKTDLKSLSTSERNNNIFNSILFENAYALALLDDPSFESISGIKQLTETKKLNLKSHIIKFYINLCYKNGKLKIYDPSTFKDLKIDYQAKIPNAPHYVKTVTSVLPIGLSHYIENDAKAHLIIDITRLLIASKIYQLTNGKLPQTPNDLTPDILPELPTQPFNNNPYTYTLPTSPDQLPNITGQFKTTQKTIKVTTQDLLHHKYP